MSEEDLILHIVNEVKKIQSEAMLHKAIVSEYEEKVISATNEKDLLRYIRESQKTMHQFDDFLSKCEGQIIAYSDILDKLGN